MLCVGIGLKTKQGSQCPNDTDTRIGISFSLATFALETARVCDSLEQVHSSKLECERSFYLGKRK